MPKKKGIKMKFNASEKRSIIKFQDGIPNRNASFDVRQFIHTEDETKKLLQVQTSQTSYVGSNAPQGYTFLVVEHDEKNNTAEFFEADIFNMSPVSQSRMYKKGFRIVLNFKFLLVSFHLFVNKHFTMKHFEFN